MKSSTQKTHPDILRHRRKCTVCHHPDREKIESFYLAWYPSIGIASVFKISDHSLMRHVIATGLEQQRQRNVRSSLERIIERACTVKVTADSVIRAVQAYTHIDDQGQWVESPTSHVVLMPGSQQKERPASTPADPEPAPANAIAGFSTALSLELESSGSAESDSESDFDASSNSSPGPVPLASTTAQISNRRIPGY